MSHWLLFYDYVEGIVEKRAPYREGHLAHLRRWHDDGRVLMAGATGDPPHGAVFVLTTEDAQEFVDADPYVQAGLVTAHRVEPWNVVI
jgi:uncharacterized protein